MNFRQDSPAEEVSSEDEYDLAEKERLNDLKERDSFADRLKKKDKEVTRKIMSKSEKKVCLHCLLQPHYLQISDCLYVNVKYINIWVSQMLTNTLQASCISAAVGWSYSMHVYQTHIHVYFLV